MGSKRLRGKSLMPVAGKTLAERVISMVKKMPFVDEIQIATTDLKEDIPIHAFATSSKLSCHRGDTLNVLNRFIEASRDLDEHDHIIRITADNPLNWISVSKKVLDLHIDNNADYTCIDGLSHIVFEVIRVGALRDINQRENITPFDQEHVTAYFRKYEELYEVQVLPSDFEGLRQDLDKYLTIDTYHDLLRFEKMYEDLGELQNADIEDIYDWLDHNERHVEEIEDNETPVVKLAGIPVGEGYPAFVIAEIGQNHNGDVNLAKKMIDMAVRCGADAVKFQKRDIDSELSKEAFDKVYDNTNSFGHTYGEHRKFLELNEKQHTELKEYAVARGITYFCTPCDIPSLEMMERIGCPFYKIASRDLTNIPLLQAVGKIGKPVIISTGMATHTDIQDAIEALNLLKNQMIIMQCTSEYPTKFENVNLRGIKTLGDKYGYVTGLSDHTSGIIISSVATVLGAHIIEKHVTLDRTMKGTDQPGSLEESGLKKLIDYIRAIELALGDGVIDFNPAVEAAKNKLARSLTSKVKINKGEVLSEDKLCLKSPGTGLLWREKDNILGKTATRTIEKDVTLSTDDFK